MKNDKQWTTNEQIDNWTAHHPPSGPEIIAAHERIRKEFNTLMKSMNGLLPEGPDKTVTLNRCRDAMNMANTCIAVAQKVYADPELQPMPFRCEICGGDLKEAVVEGMYVHADTTAGHDPVIAVEDFVCEQCGGTLTSAPSSLRGTYILFRAQDGKALRHVDDKLAVDHEPVL